ncbi:EAL domain-containing protein [Jatrophihabitans fulvus]
MSVTDMDTNSPALRSARPRPGPARDGVPTPPRPEVRYIPILDVERGVAAGYQAQVHTDPGRPAPSGPPVAPSGPDRSGETTAHAIRTALAAVPTLPKHTFLTLPVGADVAARPAVRDALASRDSLAGVILDVTGFSAGRPVGDLELALAEYRERGARIAVGGNGAAQPELTSIVRLKPSLLRLGRDWIRGVDSSEAKRSAVEVIGQLAGQLDAWILAEGVTTTAELRSLAGLGVPLAQGPLVGEGRRFWPSADVLAGRALPELTTARGDRLRPLLEQAYTTRDAVAAGSLQPGTIGFDVMVVLDGDQRPTAVLEHSATGWANHDVLVVPVETPVADTVARAMARPRETRFGPLACTDTAGRFLGIVRIERLLAHLSSDGSTDTP